MTLIAEIISTGDEVRTGAVVDSNAAWLSTLLESHGMYVKRHTVIGDDREDLVDGFREVGGRADIVLVTGGIGPTDDDITSECAALAAGVDLFYDPEAYKNVEDYFTKRNRKAPEGNKKQAMFPIGAEWIYNACGTAPGFTVKIGKAVFFFMPGVPSEMRWMTEEEVLPRIHKILGEKLRTRIIRSITTFGLPESLVNERLKALYTMFDGVKLGLRAHFPEIHVRLYADSETREQAVGSLDKATAYVEEMLGDYVVSPVGASVASVVGDLLRRQGKTLATAESCTGGLISSMITDVAGSSDYFLFSGVTYANDAKERVLGVSHDTLTAYGAVSEETAGEMAEGVRRAAKADVGLSTTGIAGPSGGTPEKPVGTVCIGLSVNDEIITRRYSYSFGDRDRNKRFFAMTALNLLRKALSSKGSL